MLASSSRPIDQLTSEWHAISRGGSARAALELLAEREPIVTGRGARDFRDLVDQLRGEIGRTDSNWAPWTVQAMLRSQDVHVLVPRALLQALLPGLVTVARRLSWGSGGDWSDGGSFFSDVITTTWEVLTAWAGQNRPYAVLDILSAVRCRMRRQIVARRKMREIAAGADLERYFPMKLAADLTDAELLARDIDDLRGNQMDAAGAAVLYGNRVLGLSMTELATLTGRSRRFLAARRRQAEEQICV